MNYVSKATKIENFDKKNAPFYLVDHGDKVSLCFVLHLTPFYSCDLGQDAFNRYAESIGDPVKENGLFTHGSGYEWEYVFRKAFEDDPNIDKITYDCEAGGFFCYGKDIDMMIDFGARFRALLNDEDTFYELICKALPEDMTQETGMNM